MRIKVAMIVLVLSAMVHAQDDEKLLDQGKIEQILGSKGSWNGGQRALKFSWPMNEPVKIDGRVMPPFMGLTTWAAFHPSSSTKGMVAGDIVLFQYQVNPVMSAALNNGLEVTGLHNHFMFDEPRIFFMHIGGEGKVEKLAEGVKKVLDAVRETSSKLGDITGFGGNALPEKSLISPKPLEEVFGKPGQSSDGMTKFVFGRYVKMHCGCEVGSDMGINSWAAFYGSDENALVDGDFAVTMEELQPALKSLRGSGVNIVAIHNHMVDETPKLFFFHYWGKGKALDLAKSVKTALEQKK